MLAQGTTGNTEASVTDLKTKGAEFTMELNNIRPGIRIAFLRGPEGVDRAA